MRILILGVMGVFFCLARFASSDDVIAATQPLEGLRDVKAPVYFPSNPIGLIFILLAAGIGAFIAWYRLIKTKRKKITELPVDTRLPWEIAYEQLDVLEKSSLLREGQFKVYYSRLSDIIRKYFENQFNIKAPEMTTEEFLWSLEESNDLTADQKNTLKKFLSSCDIVKFAKYIPQIKEGQDSFQFARELIRATKRISDQSPMDTQ